MLRDIAWMSVATAAGCVLGLVLLAFGLVQENWFLIAGAAVAGLLAFPLAVLGLKE